MQHGPRDVLRELGVLRGGVFARRVALRLEFRAFRLRLERIRVARRQRRQAPREFRLRLGGFFFDLFFEFFPERVSRESEPRSRLGSKRLHLEPVGVRRRRRGFHRGFGIARRERARRLGDISFLLGGFGSRLGGSRLVPRPPRLLAHRRLGSLERGARRGARGLERRSSLRASR